MSRPSSSALILALLALTTGPALASTITVTSTADGIVPNGDCTLREAVQAANDNVPVDGCAAGAPGASKSAGSKIA